MPKIKKIKLSTSTWNINTTRQLREEPETAFLVSRLESLAWVKDGTPIFQNIMLFAYEISNYRVNFTNNLLILAERNGTSQYGHTSKLTEDHEINLSMSEVINYNSPSTDGIVLFISPDSQTSKCLADYSERFLLLSITVTSQLHYLSLFTLDWLAKANFGLQCLHTSGKVVENVKAFKGTMHNWRVHGSFSHLETTFTHSNSPILTRGVYTNGKMQWNGWGASALPFFH